MRLVDMYSNYDSRAIQRHVTGCRQYLATLEALPLSGRSPERVAAIQQRIATFRAEAAALEQLAAQRREAERLSGFARGEL